MFQGVSFERASAVELHLIAKSRSSHLIFNKQAAFLTILEKKQAEIMFLNCFIKVIVGKLLN